jgi:pyrroline-5-carboxylate reductase
LTRFVIPPAPDALQVAFIGGGNMAGAILGGLIDEGLPPLAFQVVEPLAQIRESLHHKWSVPVMELAAQSLQTAHVVVWAVKPQVFEAAAAPVKDWTLQALHLSVAAGISCTSLGQWLQTSRVVRAMPNTPALIGQGMTGLFAPAGVSTSDRDLAQCIMSSVGQTLWLQQEHLMDAVTALSGSGPAYVFYFLEAMIQAGTDMGLSEAQARQFAVQTFVGSSALAAGSDEPMQTLRERVTSKSGTTHAAISHLQTHQVNELFKQALCAARDRAITMGKVFAGPQG